MWRQLLKLDRSPGTALQIQLRSSLANAILDGRLPDGLRLPSSRDLARILDISRNTVLLVYERLVAEGHLESRTREGHFVRATIKRTGVAPLAAEPVSRLPAWERHFRQPGTFRWLDRPSGWQKYRYAFVYGQFDPKLFPLSDWRECNRLALEVGAVRNWGQDDVDGGSGMLIDQLIRTVLPRRGISARPEEVMLTMGTQHGLYMLSKLLCTPGRVVGVEDPGYMDARNIFSHDGARIVALPVDEEGLSMTPTLGACQFVYCTPSHQCPTGVTMSTQRRLELLDHASRYDQLIIEDDYDPETQYVGQPLPALKAIDKCDRVIYLSSLSKLLSPGLRVGFIVAPAVVIERLRELRRLMIRQVPGNNERTAALFIRHGHYDRLLHNTRESLRQRAGLLTHALRETLPDLTFREPQGGASLWVTLPGQIDQRALFGACSASGLLFDPGEPFFHEPSHPPCVRLGFSVIDAERIVPGVEEFARHVNALRRRPGRATRAR
ncbi:GntR family transcriptional regulator [Paraburkholderia unamae]|nr:GntR family transcriptional regulator [Paraburkholderia unamae]CAG9265554.1 GntR family transcriptional regulator [Paraburkholderia unamae]